jgi:hypothetical protein
MLCVAVERVVDQQYVIELEGILFMRQIHLLCGADKGVSMQRLRRIGGGGDMGGQQRTFPPLLPSRKSVKAPIQSLRGARRGYTQQQAARVDGVGADLARCPCTVA